MRNQHDAKLAERKSETSLHATTLSSAVNVGADYLNTNLFNMAYDAFIGYGPNGEEIWADYSWLKNGCINEQYFNWMYSMYTGQAPHIRQMVGDGIPYRKFTASLCDWAGENDWVSHYRRFIITKID